MNGPSDRLWRIALSVTLLVSGIGLLAAWTMDLARFLMMLGLLSLGAFLGLLHLKTQQAIRETRLGLQVQIDEIMAVLQTARRDSKLEK